MLRTLSHSDVRGVRVGETERCHAWVSWLQCARLDKNFIWGLYSFPVVNVCLMVLSSSRLMEGVASDSNGSVSFRVIIVSGTVFEIRLVWLHHIRYFHVGLESLTNSFNLLSLTKLGFEMCYGLPALQLSCYQIAFGIFFLPCAPLPI